MSRDKQIEEMAKILCGMKNGCDGCMFNKLTCSERKDAEAIYNAGYRKQSEVIRGFVKRFEYHLQNATFSLGQKHDMQYALEEATKEMEGGEGR